MYCLLGVNPSLPSITPGLSVNATSHLNICLGNIHYLLPVGGVGDLLVGGNLVRKSKGGDMDVLYIKHHVILIVYT